MGKSRWVVLGFGGLAIVMLVAVGGWVVFGDGNAIKITREWARVEPLPASARDVRVKVNGNMFTRGFIVEFTADRKDVEAWLTASAGTREAKFELKDGVRRYVIRPGGGAQYAEVVVDEKTWRVRVRAQWS